MNKPEPLKRMTKSLTLSLSFWVVSIVALLFLATLTVMFHFSLQAVKEEALAKASETLDGTVKRIDNELHKVEVASVGFHWSVEHHLDSPEAIRKYCRQIVENNPLVMGCAIGLEPYFYGSQEKEFFTYAYRNDNGSGMQSEKQTVFQIDQHINGSYMEQDWYQITKEQDAPCWIKSHKVEGIVAVGTYCLPLHDAKGRLVGIMAAGISLDNFSQTILETKPFPNSYCAMIGRKGTYIVHPDTTKLHRLTVYDLPGAKSDDRLTDLFRSMMAGESGYKSVTLNGQESYVFYMPFHSKGWIAAIVCPKSDVLGASERLQKAVAAITVAGVLGLLLFCMFVITKSLAPLKLLAEKVRRLSEGHYDEPIPDSTRGDEIGSLQNSFQAMQQSIARYVGDISQMNNVLKESNEALHAAYEQAQEADHVKNAFIGSMTDQMVRPVEMIEEMVGDVDRNFKQIDGQEMNLLVERLHQQTTIVTSLLDSMLEVSQRKGGRK